MEASQPTPERPANSTPLSGTPEGNRARRAGWLRALHQWHWISSAVSLFGMLMFAITGITLNHAGAIESKPRIETRVEAMPTALVETLRLVAASPPSAGQSLPADAVAWVGHALDVRLPSGAAEWSEGEIYLALPRPGGDAWLRLDLEAGEAEYELTDRGWIAWLNDLHKGRNTGEAWRWFIDIFAVACVLFSLTGLLILQAHAANRPAVWPTVGFGVVLPVLLALLFIH
ncbi:PepSY-associated TM helix domain-containing protein [Thauera sp. 28]|uniref:PepSY-associated TM helix domain-containing protein n=1 Tax=Thauera sp. 28 TaxID=303682 RepID=UPI0002E4B2F9